MRAAHTRFMDRITALKFQVEALQKEYLSELSRRESVRASLAVPVAVLSFAAFGFAELANNAIWLDTGLATRLLSTLTAALTVLAALLLFAAILQLAQVRFTSRASGAKVLNFVSTADAIRDELKTDGLPGNTVETLSMMSALEAMSGEYAGRTKELKVENDRNLNLQENILAVAIPGFGFLILAVAIATGLKIASNAQDVAVNGQIPVNNASLITDE